MRSKSRRFTIRTIGFAFVLFHAQEARPFQAIQNTIEVGPEIFQGSDSTVYRPDISIRASLATRYDVADFFALVGRFTANGFNSSQSGFPQETNARFFGFGVGYNPCVRLKIGNEGVVPYIEGGGLAQLSFASLRSISNPAVTSANQLALKFGYTAGLGIDWFADSSSGRWGFGAGLTYFAIISGPGFLDFASGPIGGSGFRADLHFSLSL